MLNGRNFQQLATLVPGVSSVNGTNQQVNAGYLGQTDLIVNGASSEQTTYTIDGVYNMTPTSLININITPSIDAINEMRVLKNAYSAKYGFAGSGQMLIETKSGTSSFHGSGYEYLRSNSLAVARPYSIVRHPRHHVPASTSTSSASISAAPSSFPRSTTRRRTKTFFFVGAELKTNHYASVLNCRSIFTPAIRTGDLSPQPRRPGLQHHQLSCRRRRLHTEHTSRTSSISPATASARASSPPAALRYATCFGKDSNGVTNQTQPRLLRPRLCLLHQSGQQLSCRFPICRKTTTQTSPTTSTPTLSSTVKTTPSTE